MPATRRLLSYTVWMDSDGVTPFRLEAQAQVSLANPDNDEMSFDGPRTKKYVMGDLEIAEVAQLNASSTLVNNVLSRLDPMVKAAAPPGPPEPPPVP